MADEIENKLKENRKRIILLETDVGALKVDVGKISVTLDQSEKFAKERHEATKSSQREIKDLLKFRIAAEKERENDAKRYRQAREKLEHEVSLSRQKWVQSLLNPQTLIIILVILLSLFGVQFADFMEIAPIFDRNLGTSPP